jgi:4-hydroxybenzoate polyprenyltransferase
VAATALLSAGAQLHPAILPMVLAVTYASYAVDRLFDRWVDSGADPLRAPLARAALLAFVAAASLAYWLGGPAIAAATLFFPLSVAAYCVPWLDRVPALARRGIRRVKDIPYTKNVYTAFCVALAALWAGIATGLRGALALGAVALCAFLQDLVNTAACDLGDVEADRANGVPTLAVLFGKAPMARALTTLSHVWAALLVLGALSGVLTRSALFAALGTLLVRAYLARLARDDSSAQFADTVPDLTDAFIGFLALLGALVGG